MDIRNIKWMYGMAIYLSNRLPSRCVYPPKYQEIMRLLRLKDADEPIHRELGERLARILRVAVETVPHYRDLKLPFSSSEITAANAYNVLSEFPFLEKRDIMHDPARFLSHRLNRKLILEGTSGGSTGEGIKIYSTYGLSVSHQAFVNYKMEQIGLGRSARYVRIGSDGRKKHDEHPFSRMPDKLMVSPYHVTDMWLSRICDRIDQFRGEVLHAYPSSFQALALHLARENRRLDSIKAILLASERITQYQLELAEATFPSIPVVFFYGLSERTNLAWGSHSAAGIKYIFDAVYGHSENRQDEYGRWEIVGTSYWNDVMPLIRYRTQDYARICDGVACDLDGREQEFLITKQGDRIPGFSVSIDKFIWDYVDSCQVVQKNPGSVIFYLQPKSSYRSEIGERMLAAQIVKWGSFFNISVVCKKDGFFTRAGKRRLVTREN